MSQAIDWAGMEVPVIGLDVLKWHHVSLPPPDSTNASPTSSPIAPVTEDAGSCSVIAGEYRTYLIWRVHKDLPHALELLEVNPDKELPRNGLRIVFPAALCPFAFICKDEISCIPGNLYLLYALTITGVAYLFKLRRLSTYLSCSVIPKSDIVELNLQSYPNFGVITVVGAAPECLLVGTTDGSVCMFQFGLHDQTTPGLMQVLRCDTIGGLWGLMSRCKAPGNVQDLVVAEVDGRNTVFVLHSDCMLHAWDLSNRCLIFHKNMSDAKLPGFAPVKLWVGELHYETQIIQLAICYEDKLEISKKVVNIHDFNCRVADKIHLTPHFDFRKIPLRKEGIIDMKLTRGKIWAISKGEILLFRLSPKHLTIMEVEDYYLSQGGFIEDQLFQNVEYQWDAIFSIACSIFSSEDQIIPFVSSMFLRRLLQPGVYYNIVLRATMQDYNKHWTDSDFDSLTVDQVKKEIISLIGHEADPESLESIVYHWQLFFTRYCRHWRNNSELFGFFVESSTDTVCLIRKYSISLVRCFKDIELFIYGSFHKDQGVESLIPDQVQNRFLFEFLQCASSASHHLSRAASTIFYESLVQSTFSCEEVIPRMVKMLYTGYSLTVSVPQGAVDARKKKATHRITQIKFGSDMFSSLEALSKKGETWSMVLDAVGSYLEYLAPDKINKKFDSEVLLTINTSICVQATSQVAKTTFESAFDILLLLSYLVSNNEQIHMSYKEISRIQCGLIPRIQGIIIEWLTVHFMGTTPSQCPAPVDFTSQLSSLQIEGNFDRRLWNEKLGKCNFILPFALLLDTKSTSAVDNRYYSTRSLPTPQNCILSVRDFTSWVVWGRINAGEEPPSFIIHSMDFATILLRHGQYDAVEILLSVVDTHARNGKTPESIQYCNGEWCTLLHLMGCTLLAQVHFGLHGLLKERKISEAARCFFRASHGQVVPQTLLNLFRDTTSPDSKSVDCESMAAWKLQYYQWVMQIFEQYNISDGACMFANAALEQADEAYGGEAQSESASTIKGGLWTMSLSSP